MRIDFYGDGVSGHLFIDIAKVDFAGGGEQPQPVYDGLYFTPAQGVASTIVGYKYDEYYNQHNKYLQTSSDGKKWTDWSEDKTVLPGTKLYVRGLDDYVRNSEIQNNFFAFSQNTEANGNIMSLVNNNTVITTEYCFSYLFQSTKIVTAPELPATTLTPYCYFSMFQNCKELINSPELPATTLPASCYRLMFDGCSSLVNSPKSLGSTISGTYAAVAMFQGCTSLNEVPTLPATTLTSGCYQNMFYGCTSLEATPLLPATKLATYCYSNMFGNCSSLKTANPLPASNMAEYCYQYMFQNCTSLTYVPLITSSKPVRRSCAYMFSGCTALTSTSGFKTTGSISVESCAYMFRNCTSLTKGPSLGATTLGNNCYQNMFEGCTKLTTAPTLPAKSLGTNCYQNMFKNCTSLVSAPALPATTLKANCYQYMFQGCTSLSTAPALPATTLTNYCYSYMFNNCTSLVEAPVLPTENMGSTYGYQYMFSGDTLLNWIHAQFTTYTQNNLTQWVQNVASNGVFVMNINATWDPETRRGVNGVPVNWKVIYYDKSLNKYYLDKQGTKECDKYGNPLVQPMYFTTHEGAGDVTMSYYFTDYYSEHNKYLQVSTDKTNWQDWTSPITITDGQMLYVQGLDNYVHTEATMHNHLFESNNKYDAHGSIMSLCNYADNVNDYALACVFESSQIVLPPELPATELGNDCYNSMFWDCAELESAPELPATTLNSSCYSYMFLGCTKLTSAPELPATSLINAPYCYLGMFQGCTSLNEAHELPATVLTGDCYKSMFYGCTSLTEAPELPAEILANGCYYSMFYGCSALRTAPALNSMYLAKDCYNSMFMNCSSLESVTILPATDLAENCYSNMFAGCSTITSAPGLPATTLMPRCYANMFMGCTLLQFAPELNATTLAENCYEGMFMGAAALDKIILNGAFNSSNASNWVLGVNTTGTFYNNADIDIERGVNGIPENWTEERRGAEQAMYFTLAPGSESAEINCQVDEYFSTHGKNLWVKYNDGEWEEFTGDALAIFPGDKMYWKGDDEYIRLANSNSPFFMLIAGDPVECHGNVMSLCNYAEEITTDYCFVNLFRGMNITTAPELTATSISNNCYNKMFTLCEMLTKAPVITYNNSVTAPFRSMFEGCASLNEVTLNGTWVATAFTYWLRNVAAEGTFYNNTGNDIASGPNGIPTGWTEIRQGGDDFDDSFITSQGYTDVTEQVVLEGDNYYTYTQQDYINFAEAYLVLKELPVDVLTVGNINNLEIELQNDSVNVITSGMGGNCELSEVQGRYVYKIAAGYAAEDSMWTFINLPEGFKFYALLEQ